jgi:hypothetical protein
MKTCHEKIRSVLSLGVLLKDDTTPDKMVTGNVFLKGHGVKRQPVRHSTGYFLFMILRKKARNKESHSIKNNINTKKGGNI